jgi:hypothetical protein
MGKTKKLFFAKHAKSSAMLVTLAIHAAIVVVAIGFVAFTVITKEEKVFEAKEVNRPQMKLKKLQVPVKIEKRKKSTPKLRKRVVAKTTRRTANIQMPEITGVLGGMGAMNISGGIGKDIGFTMPEINFFGIKKKSEKVVFVVLAGPASTNGSNGRQSPKSRMCFYTLRARLNDMVEALPEYALFNATFFMAQITTPFSTNMLLATEENKALMKEWASTVNPLELEETYGPGDNYEGFWQRFIALDWEKGERWEGPDVPPVYPKWLYHYNPGPHIQKFFRQGENEREDQEFVHWNRAACFALEQKPDAIFILTTNYIGEDENAITQAFLDICAYLYGPDRKKYPSINVVVMARSGQDEDGVSNVMSKYMPIVNTFRGKTEAVNDIRDLMTPEERAAMDKLDGVF